MKNPIIAALGLLFAAPLFAATPESGTLTPEEDTIEYGGGPFVISNITGQAGDPECQNPVLPCDDFSLTVELPEDFIGTYPSALVRVVIGLDSPVSGTPDDYDLYLLNADGSIIGQSTSPTADEAVSVLADPGVNEYTVRVVPFTAVASGYAAKVDLVRGEPAAPLGGEEGDGETKRDSFAGGSHGGSAGGGSLGLGLVVLAGLAGWRRRSPHR